MIICRTDNQPDLEVLSLRFENTNLLNILGVTIKNENRQNSNWTGYTSIQM